MKDNSTELKFDRKIIHALKFICLFFLLTVFLTIPSIIKLEKNCYKKYKTAEDQNCLKNNFVLIKQLRILKTSFKHFLLIRLLQQLFVNKFHLGCISK